MNPVPPGESARATAPPPSPGDDDALRSLLMDWLPPQRWFAGSTGEAVTVTIADRMPVTSTDAVVVELVLIDVNGAGPHPSTSVVDADTAPARYQLLIGWRTETPERVAHAIIGAVDDQICYDALHDADVTALLLDAIDAATRPAGGTARDLGSLSVLAEPDAQIGTDLPGLVIAAEQSNTSIVYGDEIIVKFYRRVQPGINPDAEVIRALHRAGNRHHARPLAEFRAAVAGESTTVALATEFFANSADGWAMATASVRDLMGEADLRADEVGGDFASEARRLGEAVAAIHHDLADLFGTGRRTPSELRAMADGMISRAELVTTRVPELAEFLEPIRATFRSFAETSGPGELTVQRIHGDLHLGQTLRTLHGWALIDFEGEPSAPVAQRRSHRSTLRDVAGMLRSFHYAADQLLGMGATDAQRAYRAAEWTARNRDAFLDGYASASGTDPRDSPVLLATFELDKAIYELGYEHDHRPGWESIPLTAIAALTKTPYWPQRGPRP